MTITQRIKFYLPAWKRALDANWRKGPGGIEIIPGLGPNEWRDKVAGAAAQVAAKENRPPTAEDLRHAGVYVATGKWSSRSLANRDTNKLVALCKLLENPEDLSALVLFQNPQNSDRAALIARIEKVPAAYVAHICRSKFKREHWRTLNDAQLRLMSITLNHRSPELPAPKPGARQYHLKP